MIRVKQISVGSYTFTENAVDDDGEPVTPSAPYTATFYDGAGTQIGTQTATCVNGVFSATIAASQLPYLDTYTILWTGSVNGNPTQWTTTVEIAGGYLFEIADLRKMDRAFTDTTKYPSDVLRAVRTAVEEVIEGPKAARRAFVPRGRRALLDGSGPDYMLGYSPLMYGNDTRTLLTTDFDIRKIRSVNVAGTDLTSDEIAAIQIRDNALFRTGGVHYPAWSYGHSNIKIHYEYGLDRPPGAITRAAKILAREYLVQSDLPGRATATSIGDQMFRLTIAGRDGLTGIPDVDAAIANHGRSSIAIG